MLSRAQRNDRRPSQHLYVLGPKAPTALRIRNRPTTRLAAERLPASFIDHQLAVNRVGDWLGTELIGERDASAGLDSKHRPDAAYRCEADERGRDLILLEVDLGHYSRPRILAKVDGFRQHPAAAGIFFACPTNDRANEVARWIREHNGIDFMQGHCQVFSFDELQRGARFEPGKEPVKDTREQPGWYAQVHGNPGHR